MRPSYVANQCCVTLLEQEAKDEFVKQIRELLMSLPRSVFIVMRYLIAFLNQYEIWTRLLKYRIDTVCCV